MARYEPRSSGKPISLYPLSFKQAVTELLKVRPPRGGQADTAEAAEPARPEAADGPS